MLFSPTSQHPFADDQMIVTSSEMMHATSPVEDGTTPRKTTSVTVTIKHAVTTARAMAKESMQINSKGQ